LLVIGTTADARQRIGDQVFHPREHEAEERRDADAAGDQRHEDAGEEARE
jgi:hypothetical protein